MKISAFFIALTLLIVFNGAQSTLLRGKGNNNTPLKCGEGESECFGICCGKEQKCCQNVWTGNFTCFPKSFNACYW